jgi:hypothetical protein
MTGTVQELPPEPASTLRARSGYQAWWHDCPQCGRDFCVYVPQGEASPFPLTQGVPCPHCHRAQVEVLVERSAQPILVVPATRAWSYIQARRARRAVDRGRRYLLGRLKGVGWTIRQALSRHPR